MRLDLVKTATFAVLHFSVGFGVAFALTGSLAISTGVALIEPAVNTVVFFFHERAWQHFRRREPKKAQRTAPIAVTTPRRREGHCIPGAWGTPQGAFAKPFD